jgi:hypothetical protein
VDAQERGYTRLRNPKCNSKWDVAEVSCIACRIDSYTPTRVLNSCTVHKLLDLTNFHLTGLVGEIVDSEMKPNNGIHNLNSRSKTAF